jgi:hypothetical protein
MLTKKSVAVVTYETHIQLSANSSYLSELNLFLSVMIDQNKTDGVLNDSQIDGLVIRERYWVDQAALDEYITFIEATHLSYGYDMTITGGDI